MRIKRSIFGMIVLLSLTLGSLSIAAAQDTTIPPATIVNDEGGPVSVTGKVAYTNGYFTAGVDEPLIILEDEAGFVDRNRGFQIPEKSQVIGKITSDFFTSPFSYSLDLPIEPQGDLRDVDQNSSKDPGVMVYGIAYWTNTWGDPFLENRDLYGGGWSGAYASFIIDPNPSAKGEVIGGKYLVYSPDDKEGFPSGFGADKKLFTKDDPIVRLPKGYTMVDMDTSPFTFDRSSHPVIDLLEGKGSEQADYSALSYTKAFDAMADMFRKKYPYTDFKHIDWAALIAKYRPQVEEAEKNNDSAAYQHALRDFLWSIHDGHVNAPVDNQEFSDAVGGGLGMAIRELDDKRTIVNYILDGGPADSAGIKLKAEILSINNTPIDEAVSNTVTWNSPSSEHYLRLQQLRYVLRFPVDTDVTIEYKNPGETKSSTAKLKTVNERDSFRFSSFAKGVTGFELPVEYHVMDNGYVYVKITSFLDSARLTIQLWERLITTLNQNQVPGIVIDMRQNGGGSGFLADQMAAYFFNDALDIGNSEGYDESLGKFYSDPNFENKFILPPENLRYSGKVAVLVGPSCASACEHFSYDMGLQDRAAIVGQYPTAGLGASVTTYLMPDGLQLQYSIARTVDPKGNIVIEGTGVVPTVKVPVNEETLFAAGDPVLDAASAYLDKALQ